MPVCKTYEEWMALQGLPVYREYYIEDVRKMKLEPWSARECNGAFLQLRGQEGVVETRVVEIPPGKTLPPLKMGVDEAVYAITGQGMTAVWAGGDKGPRKTFEWGPHSLFLVPRNCWYQVSNMSGSQPARLIQYNYLPVALAATPDVDFFINSRYEDQRVLQATEDDFYSQAQAVAEEPGNMNRAAGSIEFFWRGNFFPDLRAWDKLSPYRGRGAGGHVIFVQFPTAEMDAHMSVFPAQTYKKGHRHGPGVVIVIPAGEGYSLMWQEGQEKVEVPWHEGSIFVPPNRWFHQHFNLGSEPARYFAFHCPPQFMFSAEKVEDLKRDQIEYPNEDPWIRQKFEEELAKRGLTSLMPEGAYKDPDYEWSYQAANVEVGR